MNAQHISRAFLVHALLSISCVIAIGACADDDAMLSDGGRDHGDGDGDGDGDAPGDGDGDGDDERDASMPDPDAGDEDAAVEEDASVDAGDDDAGDDAGEPLTLGGLTVNMSMDEQELDVFGETGHRFWVEIDNEQVDRLNDEGQGCGIGCGGDDIYTPGTPESGAAYASHVLIQDVASEGVADYGKVEVGLVGESTFRQWDSRHIPNLRLDADEFEEHKRIGGFEHLRLNNSLVGSIFREGIAHRIYRELGYPALRSSYAFLGSNVWGDDIWVPMTLIEVYKLKFCKDNEELVGGRCVNMWEFAGDLGGGGGFPGPEPFPIPIDPLDDVPDPRPIDPFPPGGLPGGDGDGVPDEWCQIHECDNTRLIETMDALAAAEHGPDFEEALADYIDWDRFHQFQCLSWIMWTGDDPLHNTNNNLIMEREDGKLVWAPYSVDISAGQDWYLNVPLTGQNALAMGCQSDPDCWAETIASCEDLIQAFDDLNPETLVDEAYAQLQEHAMIRDGDQERAEALRYWFEWRQSVLADELERFRYLPDAEGNCANDLELCGDQTCGTPEQCLERMCLIGEEMCTSLDRCVNPQWEECPVCEEELSPHYCEWNTTCVADQDACIAACDDDEQMEWCADWNSCVSEGECGGIIID